MNNTKELSILQRPELRSPYMVTGLGGWLNAAEVATGAVSYLIRKLGGRRFAEIAPWEFYNFTILRPVVVSKAGVVESLTWPSNDFYFCVNEHGEHDLVLFRGQEPHLRWQTYVDMLLEVAKTFGVGRMYLLGGYFDALPHTREPKVSAGASHAYLKKELDRVDVQYSDYQGPTGITSLLRFACAKAGIEAISLSGRAPHYITTANPQVCHSVLLRLMGLLDMEMDLEPIRLAGEHLEHIVGKILAENAGLRRYVETLEQAYDQSLEYRGPMPELSDRIIKEVEDFLKQQRGGGGGEWRPEDQPPQEE